MAETSPYASGRQQAQRLRALLLTTERQQRYAVYEAFLTFGQSPVGLVILDHLAAKYLLQDCETLIDEGKCRLVRYLGQMIAEAPAMLEALRLEGETHG